MHIAQLLDGSHKQIGTFTIGPATDEYHSFGTCWHNTLLWKLLKIDAIWILKYLACFNISLQKAFDHLIGWHNDLVGLRVTIKLPLNCKFAWYLRTSSCFQDLILRFNMSAAPFKKNARSVFCLCVSRGFKK